MISGLVEGVEVDVVVGVVGGGGGLGGVGEGFELVEHGLLVLNLHLEGLFVVGVGGLLDHVEERALD